MIYLLDRLQFWNVFPWNIPPKGLWSFLFFVRLYSVKGSKGFRKSFDIFPQGRQYRRNAMKRIEPPWQSCIRRTAASRLGPLLDSFFILGILEFLTEEKLTNPVLLSKESWHAGISQISEGRLSGQPFPLWKPFDERFSTPSYEPVREISLS